MVYRGAGMALCLRIQNKGRILGDYRIYIGLGHQQLACFRPSGPKYLYCIDTGIVRIPR